MGKAGNNRAAAFEILKAMGIQVAPEILEQTAEEDKEKREKIAEYKKACYAANREREKERVKAYRETNREKITEYKKAHYAANREQIKEQEKTRYQANREKILARKKAYYEANREKIAEYHKAYYKARREAARNELKEVIQ